LKCREEWIDLSKGLAIILVVIIHLLLGLSESKIFNHSLFLNYFYFTLKSFLMQLFFLISGYLYAKGESINLIIKYPRYIIKKFLNLMMPYFIFSIIFILVNMYFGKEVNERLGLKTILQIPLNPIAHFWFLYTLFAVFLITPFLDLLIKNDFIVLALLFALKIVGVHSGVFFVDSFSAWAVYFYFGKAAHNYLVHVIKDKPNMLGIGGLLYIILNISTYELILKQTQNSLFYNAYSIVLAFLGIALLIFIIIIIEKGHLLKRLLNLLGLYSFQIYILHTFFAAGIRIFLMRLGIFNLAFHIIAGLLVAIVFPLCIGLMARHIWVLDRVFYPSKLLTNVNKAKIVET